VRTGPSGSGPTELGSIHGVAVQVKVQNVHRRPSSAPGCGVCTCSLLKAPAGPTFLTRQPTAPRGWARQSLLRWAGFRPRPDWPAPYPPPPLQLHGARLMARTCPRLTDEPHPGASPRPTVVAEADCSRRGRRSCAGASMLNRMRRHVQGSPPPRRTKVTYAVVLACPVGRFLRALSSWVEGLTLAVSARVQR
jgi:hypothetical protein